MPVLKTMKKRTPRKKAATKTAKKAAKTKAPPKPIKKNKKKLPKKPKGDFDLFQHAFCLEVDLKLGPQTSQVKGDDVQLVVKGKKIKHKEQFRVHKQLIDCPEFDAIKSWDNTIRGYCRDAQLPIFRPGEISMAEINKPKFNGRGVFRSGVYLVPLDRLDEVAPKMVAMEKERKKRIKAYVKAYPQRVKEQRKRLGPAFDPEKYFTNPKHSIPNRITMRFGIYERLVGKNIISMNEAIARKEKRKQFADMKSDAQGIVNGLRIELLRALKRILTILGKKKEGERTRLDPSNTANLVSTLQWVMNMNVLEDNQIDAMVTKIKRTLGGKGTTIDDDINSDLVHVRLNNNDDYLEQTHDQLQGFCDDLESKVITDESRDDT